MTLIILAAGKGERLLPFTRNTPKPLVDIGNGSTLLDRQLALAEASGVVDEVVLLVGYLAEQIEARARVVTSERIRVTTIFNPFYEITSSLMSLWLARDRMRSEDFMVMNGDNLFTFNVFRELALQNPGDGIYLSVATAERYSDDDMKVCLKANTPMLVSKTIASESADATSVGLALVRGEQQRGAFLRHVEALARDRTRLTAFWHETFNALYDGGVKVMAWPLDGDKWQEIDLCLDVARARHLIRGSARAVSSQVVRYAS